MRALGVAVAAALALTALPVAAAPSAAPSAAPGAALAVAQPAAAEPKREVVVIGHSSSGREILAAHRWWPGEKSRRAVIIGQLHGNETAGRLVVNRLNRYALPHHLELWLVVSANPDGFRAQRRTNAHGVDLNRNFPYNWRPSARTSTWAGPSRASEVETRAIMRFLREVRPRTVVSMHQPLDGVDAYHAKRTRLGHVLARETGLPLKVFDCHSGCYGTLTQWFNNTLPGTAITLELPGSVSTASLDRVAHGIRRTLILGA